MSMPSASCAVQMGVMVSRACCVSRHDRPAMLPESSIKNTVSKLLRKAYRSSAGRGVRTCGTLGCALLAFGVGGKPACMLLGKALGVPPITAPGSAGEYAGGG